MRPHSFLLAMLPRFVEDPLHKNGHLAMHGKRRVVGVYDVADQDKYNEFDELPAKGSRTSATEKKFKIIKKTQVHSGST